MSESIKPEERILNCLPSPQIERDWTFGDAVSAEIVAVPAEIQRSIDLREDWWKIGDQEKTGSCVGWAVSEVVRWYFVKAGKKLEDDRLSPRYIWMASKEMDPYTDRATTFIEVAGTYLKTALDVARIWGVVQDSVLPFVLGQLYQDNDENVFYALAAQLKIASYFNLHNPYAKPELSGYSLFDRWRIWLATQGPIVTRLDVDDTWMYARNYSNLDEYQPYTTEKWGGHAVALVGYTPDRFIVRNSWGTDSWGDKGYGYASLEYAEAAFNPESYGISV